MPKLNYSGNDFKDAVNIEPHSILFDYGIKDYAIEVSNNQKFLKLFFRNSNAHIPFDLFGAAFWLLSRYEEYLPHKTDKFNRFHYKSCLAYQYNFLEIPLVNVWINELKKIISEKFPELSMKQRKYNFVSTIDIDNVFKYKNKGLVRTLAGYVSDMMKNNAEGVRKRTSIIFNRTKDPFDCYDFLIKENYEKNISTIYFLLLGDYGINDKNHSASDLRFQALIKHLGDYSSIGIHPSFGSNNNLQQLKVEISRLANITHRQIVKSRQHFSMLKFPQTYQSLLQAGIGEDYSMGYTNMNGFRASYCFPFKWYSLDDEQETTLVIHSFAVTENTLKFFSEKDKKDFMELALPLINEVKKAGGEMISIFHNDTFDDLMKEKYSGFLSAAK
ncbi:MAG: hypothetical protein K0S32_3980 [Bacteroidetes bacterium]|nr:hypothetical protein [Bacteroidota bacterium]